MWFVPQIFDPLDDLFGIKRAACVTCVCLIWHRKVVASVLLYTVGTKK